MHIAQSKRRRNKLGLRVYISIILLQSYPSLLGLRCSFNTWVVSCTLLHNDFPQLLQPTKFWILFFRCSFRLLWKALVTELANAWVMFVWNMLLQLFPIAKIVCAMFALISWRTITEHILFMSFKCKSTFEVTLTQITLQYILMC